MCDICYVTWVEIIQFKQKIKDKIFSWLQITYKNITQWIISMTKLSRTNISRTMVLLMAIENGTIITLKGDKVSCFHLYHAHLMLYNLNHGVLVFYWSRYTYFSISYRLYSSVYVTGFMKKVLYAQLQIFRNMIFRQARERGLSKSRVFNVLLIGNTNPKM